VKDNAASDRIDSIWLENNHVDLDAELIGTTDITMRRTMMKLASLLVRTISYGST
jgi:hypothetical protein